MKYKKRHKVIHNGTVIGSIFLRGDIYWFAHRVNGKPEWDSLKTNDLKEALQAAEDIAIDSGPVIPQAPTADQRRKVKTLSEILSLYKVDYEKRRRKSTARRAFEILEKFIQFVGQQNRADVVEREHVERFRDSREACISKSTKRKLSPWTINNDVGRVRHFLRWAARKKFRRAAPDLTDMKLPTPNKKARGLSQAEVGIVRTKLERHPELSDWFELAINVGFRPAEQAHLRACDYDEKAHKVWVRPWGDWKPKTARGERNLPVNGAAQAVLLRLKERAVAEMNRLKLKKKPEGDGLLFPNPVGGIWDLDNLRHHFTGNGKWKGALPEGMFFTLYCCRHTYAHREVAAGKTTQQQLMMRMGHSDPKTTKGYFEGMDLDDIGPPPDLEPLAVAAEA